MKKNNFVVKLVSFKGSQVPTCANHEKISSSVPHLIKRQVSEQTVADSRVSISKLNMLLYPQAFIAYL